MKNKYFLLLLCITLALVGCEEQPMPIASSDTPVTTTEVAESVEPDNSESDVGGSTISNTNELTFIPSEEQLDSERKLILEVIMSIAQRDSTVVTNPEYFLAGESYTDQYTSETVTYSDNKDNYSIEHCYDLTHFYIKPEDALTIVMSNIQSHDAEITELEGEYLIPNIYVPGSKTYLKLGCCDTGLHITSICTKTIKIEES